MASSPQYSDFQIIILLKKINNVLFYTIFVLSIGTAFIDKEFKTYFDYINIISMVMYSILTFYVDYYLFPRAEQVRRRDFIDNSFGTILNINQSEGYFSNDEKAVGIYKAATNLFENSLFTTNISKRMLPNKIIVSTIFIVVIIVLAVNGFSNTQFAVPTLQVFLSTNILGELIKLFLFIQKNEVYFDNLREVFTNEDFKVVPEKYLPNFLKTYLDYETNLAWGTILLDGKIYNQLNPTLSKEWENIKVKLKI